MKSFTFIFFLSLLFCSAYAQNNAITNGLTEKVIGYYNAGKADSLYTLFADEVKPQLPLTSLNTAVQQLKSGLGAIVKSEYMGKEKNGNVYIATFERSGPVLYISFNAANKLTAFYVGADQRELPGSVTVKSASAVLKGTLSVSQVTKPVPVVLLISGSGPTDRNGNSQLANVNPNYLLQISDSLKLKNIAVLRYDKRGVGQSTTMTDITFDDMVNDAVAIIKMLKADKRFSKVIVAGHSEGSLVGMIACQREKTDAFISLSGAGFPSDDILKTQIKDRASIDDYKVAASIIDSIKAGKTVKQKLSPGFQTMFNKQLQPYLHSWMQYDPRLEITKLTEPVLIIQGTNDIQVSVANAEQLKKARPNAQLKLIKGMSHILKEAPADRQQNMATYTASNLPLHPQLIPTLTQFINGLK